MLEKEVLKEIQKIVDYLYEAEADDFEEVYFTDETNVSQERLEEEALKYNSLDFHHIFCSVVRLKNYLKEGK